MAKILYDYKGDKTKVRGIVVYPEWWTDEPRGVDVWVLNHQRVVHYIRREPATLDAATIHVLADGLARYFETILPNDMP